MTESTNVATVKRFFDIADGRVTGNIAELFTELFTEDAEIYRPKFTGSGREAIMPAAGALAMFRRFVHHADEFEIVEHRSRVIVEGTTEGETVTGHAWDGRNTIAGRFCSIFDFRDGQICRMHVYFDPDFGDGDPIPTSEEKEAEAG